ncbi:TetR/AcrR family transcriptional regulator [Acidimangrovimonas pyrenivorans]|uniref:TetR/AcrR family transcriptional regulator n=1 Tax=Acidimangrovimonas pyrenivorans TaxID=2030798 RepID=A0ABV7ADG6_9RHOB
MTDPHSPPPEGAEVPCRRRGRPVQLDPDTRIARVLDATEALLADQGVDRISMSAIARAAGMSKRTVYELFASREELIGACLRRMLASVFRPLAPDEAALPLPERLRIILTMHWAPGIEDRSLEILRAAIAETRRQPALARHLLDNGFSELSGRIEEELRREVDRGALALDDIPLAAEILRDMVCENPVAALLDPTRPASDRRNARAARRDRAIEIFCRGIA